MAAKRTVTPKRILDMGWNFARARVLTTAVELDVFTHIANGKRTVDEIAKAASSSLRGTEMLCNALVGLELLTKDKEGPYHLAADSEEFLVRNKPGYLGAMCLHTARLNETWSHLTESVKAGRPYTRLGEKDKTEEFFPDLAKALFNMNYPAALYAASYIKNKRKEISSILDVACGSAVWGIGVMQQFKFARLTAIDLPVVCNIAREYVKNFNMTDRFECIEGDIRSIDFGKDRYDVVILGHICHSEGKVNTEKLLKKSYDAMKSGGDLLIAEFLPNDDKTAPEVPLLFALNMLVNTDEGDIYTIGQFQKWLRNIGFDKIEILEAAPSISPLILATK